MEQKSHYYQCTMSVSKGYSRNKSLLLPELQVMMCIHWLQFYTASSKYPQKIAFFAYKHVA
jgi:hypothetical protein